MLLKACQRGLSRNSYQFLISAQKRYIFGFSPTSTPEGLEHFELLYRENEKESTAAIDFLKTNGYLSAISLRNIDSYPLSLSELRDLRQKLQLPLDAWISPPLFEDEKSAASLELLLQRIVDGYKAKQKQQSYGRQRPDLYDKMYADAGDEDEYKVSTPIFYHKSEQKAIIAKPADKIISITKPSKKEIDQSYFGDENKRYQVLGTQWHKGGAKFYDNDDGMDWDHVKFEDYVKKEEKKFKDWKEWGDLRYQDENLGEDPNDCMGFTHRVPYEPHPKRKKWH